MSTNLASLPAEGEPRRARVRFCYPSATIPVSVTGRECQLACAHCGGRYLDHMVPLAEASQSARAGRARSLLVSGGCDAGGRVPLAEHADEIGKLRQGRQINWHVGLAEETDIEGVSAGDVVSFDIPASDRVIRCSYGLERSFSDYMETYRRLRQRCSVVPHITVGLDPDHPQDELSALESLASIGASSLVVLVFTPTRGTRYADRRPPPAEQVVAVMVAARRMLPDTPAGLGCMRPAGAYRSKLDPMVLAAGTSWIVNPSADAVRYAAVNGFEVDRTFECCVF